MIFTTLEKLHVGGKKQKPGCVWTGTYEHIWQYFNIRVDLEELTVTLACYQVKHRANMQLESTVIKTEVHQRSENK